MFKLIGSQQLEKPTGTCDNCGHGIAQLFYICDDETHKRMTVGSECVAQLLKGQEAASADLSRRRMQRATTQWRKREPAPKIGETRETYINRRVSEMANALQAYKAWAAQTYRHDGKRILKLTARALRMNGIAEVAADNEAYYRYRHLREMVMSAFSARQHNRQLKRIERKFNANRYDFTRAIWDVRKL